ncbi:MAG: hypothetical protein FD173_2073 [Gallionellaceae bacterium]|nr:MAG: hypothetical protein FD173_2073 [Gallionellaceae bacterium]
MKNILKMLAVAVLCFSQSAYAKEIAVLLPVNGPLTPFEKAELTRQAADGFSSKFELMHGDEVERFVKQVFQDESKKKDCDEANCYRRIAARYHAEKIVALHVTQVEKGRYLVTSHLYDVPTGEMTSSQKMECTQCSFEKLKVLCKEIAQRLSEAK